MGSARASARRGWLALRLGVGICTALLLVAAPQADAAGTLTGVTIQPATLILAPNQTHQFRAFAHYTNPSSMVEITTTPPPGTTVEWTTGSSQFARVSATGLVTARGPGLVEIRAALVEGTKKTKGVANLTVDAGPITDIITRPKTKKLEVGRPELFKARAVYASGYEGDITSRVSWSSSRPNIASVEIAEPSKGLVSPLAVGTTNIRASDPVSGLSNSDGLTTVQPAVTRIEFDSTHIVLGRRMKGYLRVEAVRSDGTTTNITDEVSFLLSTTGIISQVSTAEETAGEFTANALRNGTVSVTAVDAARVLSTQTPAVVQVAGLLNSLEIEPDPFEVEVGEERNPKVFGTLSSGMMTQDLRKTVIWQIDNVSVASVGNTSDDRGVVTGLSPGTTTLRAVASLVGAAPVASTATGNLVVEVAQGPPVKLITKPTSKNLEVGLAQEFSARTLDAAGVERDVTERVTWSSTNPGVASVDADGLVTPHAVGTTTIRANDPITGFTNTNADGATAVLAAVTHLAFDEEQLVLGRGMKSALRVYAHRTDGSRTNITDDVEWLLSPVGPISISDENATAGEVTALADGIVVVNGVDPKRELSTATGDGPAVVQVDGTLVSLAVEPDPFRVGVGEERNARAIGTLSSGNKTTDLRSFVQWQVVNGALASVGNTTNDRGRVKGLVIGVTTLRATEPASNITSTATNNLEVRGAITSISVEPAEIVLGRNVEIPIRAYGNREDGSRSNITSSVEWTSTSFPNPARNVARIDEDGRLRGLVNGTAKVSAFDPKSGKNSNDSGQSATVTVDGLLTGIRIEPEVLRVDNEARRKARAIGLLDSGSETSDLREGMEWRVDDQAIALIGNGQDTDAPDGEPLERGEVFGLTPGTTMLHARDPRSGIEGSAELRVLGRVVSVEVEQGNDGLVPEGEMVRFKARATLEGGDTSNISDKCEWSVDDPSAATVDNVLPDKGQVTGLVTGLRTLVRVDCSGFTASAEAIIVGMIEGMRIDPADFTGKALASKRFRAFIEYDGDFEADVTNESVWLSTHPVIASVDNDKEKGLVTFYDDGEALIVAVAPSGHVAGSNVTVTGGVIRLRITPGSKTLRGSTGANFVVLADLSDGTVNEIVTPLVAWSSSDEAIAHLSDVEGEFGFVLTGNVEGTATLTASLPSGQTATADVTVQSLLNSLQIRPTTQTLAPGQNRRLTVRGTFSDGGDRSVTRFVDFETSDPDVATIESHGLNPGRITGIDLGTATITATDPASGIVSGNVATITVR